MDGTVTVVASESGKEVFDGFGFWILLTSAWRCDTGTCLNGTDSEISLLALVRVSCML